MRGNTELEMWAIENENLTKSYRHRRVADKIDLKVRLNLFNQKADAKNFIDLLKEVQLAISFVFLSIFALPLLRSKDFIIHSRHVFEFRKVHLCPFQPVQAFHSFGCDQMFFVRLCLEFR